MTTQRQFTGIWKGTYWYPSNTHDGEDFADYELQVVQVGRKLSFESRPNDIGSHMTLVLTTDGQLATGSWLEHTSATGEFGGMIYSGALQLIISDDSRSMDGKWVGIGREKLDDGGYEPQIYSGRWSMERIGDMTHSGSSPSTPPKP